MWKVRLVSLPWMYMYADIIDVPGGKNDAIAAINSQSSKHAVHVSP